jgi:hypothetical protein
VTQPNRVRRKTLVNEIARIEAIERGVLVKLGHQPNDLNAVLDRLRDGYQVRPRNRQAYFALMALLHIRDLKVTIWGDDPVLAASAALRVGVYGGSVPHEALNVEAGRVAGGETTGSQRRARAAAHDESIKRLYRTWASSDNLQDDYRSPITFIRAKIPKISRKTIERRLKILDLQVRQ